MKQKFFAKWLKGIILGVAVCGLIVYFHVLPILGQLIVAYDPAASYCFWPWLWFLWLSGIPCYLVLFFGWKVITNVGQDKSFSVENARLLKWISLLAGIDAAFFFLGNLILLFLNMNHPGVAIASLFVEFVGIAVAVAAAALSHLVDKAAVLQEQSDLTI